MTAVLLFALTGPVLAAAAAFDQAAFQRRDPAAVVRIGSALTAALWVVLLIADERVDLGRFEARPIAAAGAIGACLLLSTTAGVLEGLDAAVGLLALGAVNAGLTSGFGEPALPLLAGVAIVAVMPGVRPRSPRSVGMATGAVVATGVALGLVRADTGAWLVPPADPLGWAPTVALVLAGGALMAAGVYDRAHGTVTLIAPGFVLALAAAGAARTSVRPGLVIPLGAAAAAAAWSAWWWRRRRGREEMPAGITAGSVFVSLGLLALAAAAAPGASDPAARLLAAASLLTAASTHPWAAAAALPGGVALAGSLVSAGGVQSVVLALAGLAVAVATAMEVARASVPRVAIHDAPVVVLLAWLLVLPTSWDWVGPAELGPYGRGTLVLLASVFAVAVFEDRRPWRRRRTVTAGEG